MPTEDLAEYTSPTVPTFSLLRESWLTINGLRANLDPAVRREYEGIMRELAKAAKRESVQ